MADDELSDPMMGLGDIFSTSKTPTKIANNAGGRVLSPAESFMAMVESDLAIEDPPPFSAVVSNPPYQEILVESTGKAVPVWPDFIFVSREICQFSSFINPARWQKGAQGTGLTDIRDYFFKSGHLQKCITMPTERAFKGVGIAGGVSIELLDHNSKTTSINFGVFNETTKTIDYYNRIPDARLDLLLNTKDEEIVIRVLNKNIGESIENSIYIAGEDNRTKKITSSPNPSPRHHYSLVSKRMYQDADYFITEDQKLPDVEYVRIYHLTSKGIASRFLPLSEFENSSKNNERIPKWKLLMMKTGAESLYRNNVIIGEPNSLSTNTWVGRNFDSKIEAENYLSYLSTYFYRYLLTLRIVSHIATANVHRFVPDLVEVTNPRTGLVGYESDWTDEDLKILFEGVLTEDDWEYIEATAIASDPIGEKKKGQG